VERRIGLLLGLFAVLLGIAGLRALQLGTLNAHKLVAASDTQQNQTDVIPARRGSIVDRNGVPLAISSPADDVSATPYLVKRPEVVAPRIAAALGVPEETILKSLVRRDTGFVYLGRNVPAAKAQKVSKIPGITLTPTMLRDYPRDWTATQVVGSTNADGTGLFGLEYSDNRLLRGTNGKREIVNDATGQPIDVHDDTVTHSGKSLKLTLDSSIQEKTEEVLKQVGSDYSPKGATAIVMDPRDGSLLAVANWPQVDANDFSAAPATALQDKATSFNYEPGSTFKAFTVAGALQDGKVTPDTSFYLPPKIKVADRWIGEAEDRGDEDLTTAGILAQSSNVGAIKIGQTLGANRFGHWVDTFGFGHQTGVDLPGEQQGLVTPPSKYSGSSMGNLPIGQGILVTPMQLAQGYAAIANGGVLRAPHIVASVNGYRRPEPKGRRVISAQTAAQLRTMLAGVFQEGGTAAAVSVPGYTLAGKTGTANKIDPKTKGYSKTKYVASFIGFAPANDPKLLIAVVVDEPHGDIYGAQVAAPAFGKIAEYALTYLRIPPSS
jgi:cell division protein FtsI/penicillin-binding protein 2